jgi:hypothetical protein
MVAQNKWMTEQQQMVKLVIIIRKINKVKFNCCEIPGHRFCILDRSSRKS